MSGQASSPKSARTHGIQGLSAGGISSSFACQRCPSSCACTCGVAAIITQPTINDAHLLLRLVFTHHLSCHPATAGCTEDLAVRNEVYVLRYVKGLYAMVARCKSPRLIPKHRLTGQTRSGVGARQTGPYILTSGSNLPAVYARRIRGDTWHMLHR